MARCGVGREIVVHTYKYKQQLNLMTIIVFFFCKSNSNGREHKLKEYFSYFNRYGNCSVTFFKLILRGESFLLNLNRDMRLSLFIFKFELYEMPRI